MTDSVGIIGCGTMGAGIAQVAAGHGWSVALVDVNAEAVHRAIEGIRARFDRLVEKGRMTSDERDSAADRLRAASDLSALGDCSLIIEAIVEDLGVKARVLRELLPHLDRNAIIATNTSSLSVSKLGAAIDAPARTVGMHFFNPAPLLKLVEVIAGDHTSPDVVDRTVAIAESWGKIVARAADVPGFIVNHVARPYYLEAFRILADGLAPADVIDATMKDLGGYRMGPLELTDLIGQDVNTATTRSVWEQLGHPPLLAPSPLQEQLVSIGHLGRKSGRGVYRHLDDGARTVAVEAPAVELDLDEETTAAVIAFVSAALDENTNDSTDALDPVRAYVFARILVALIAQACLAQGRGVASSTDIDTALKYGTNHPRGPFEWMERVGTDRCLRLLEALNRSSDDDRFAPPKLPRTMRDS